MKTLLINGSSHEQGCTFTALSEVADTLNKNGIETEILQLGSGAVNGCTGCGGCAKTGKCVHDKDMVNLAIDRMKEADALVIGSPVYFASPNGALIACLDRLFYAGKSVLENKPAAAVVSARRAGTTASLEVLQKYFMIRNMPLVSSTYWPMVHGSKPEDVKKDQEGLQTMRTLGNNMAWLLKSMEAGKKSGLVLPERETPIKTNFIN